METNNAGMPPKTIAIVSYITFIGWIIAFVLNSSNKSSLGGFHVRQSLGLVIMLVAFSIIGIIPFLGWIIYLVGIIATLVLWILGLISAANGEEKPVPVVGEYFQQWFAGIA